jgi:hypothetical protein
LLKREHLEPRPVIAAQHVAVVAVGIAGHNRQHAKPQDLIEPMGNLPRLSRILQASRQPVPKVQASFDILERTRSPPPSG